MPEDLSPSPGLLRVKITCPLFPVADVEAASVQIPADQGVRLILPNRAPLFCLVNRGEVVINKSDGDRLFYLISDGVCEIRRDICSIMAWGVRSDEVDLNKIQKQLQETEAALVGQNASAARQELTDRLSFYRFILNR